jgi:Zn-dependent protease
MLSFDPLSVVYYTLSLFPAMILHELAHGFVADRMGDMTPRLHGRLTLNPRRHIDPFGSLVLPGLLVLPHLFGRPFTPVFGYAKPMPLDPSSLKNPDRKLVGIMLVGPAVNIVLAALAGVVYRFVGGLFVELDRFVLVFIGTNLLVGVLHLMPIPPLDGARILGTLLPPRAREVMERLEPYGALFMLLIFFIFSGPVLFIVLAIQEGLIDLLVG